MFVSHDFCLLCWDPANELNLIMNKPNLLFVRWLNLDGFPSTPNNSKESLSRERDRRPADSQRERRDGQLARIRHLYTT